MSGLRRCGATFALSALALTLGGCLKFDQKLIVLPDGSGKLVVFLNALHVEVFTADGVQAMPEISSAADIDSYFEGFSAATKPKTDTDDEGWGESEFTIYFDDINAFKMIRTDEVKETLIEFRFGPAGKGHRLTVTNTVMKTLGKVDAMARASSDAAGALEAHEAMLGELLAPFRISESYTMPGRVTSADGLQKKSGRTASLLIEAKQLKTFAKRTKLAKSTTRTITCRPSSMTDEEIAAFKDEAARAKAAWAKLRADDREE